MGSQPYHRCWQVAPLVDTPGESGPLASEHEVHLCHPGAQSWASAPMTFLLLPQLWEGPRRKDPGEAGLRNERSQVPSVKLAARGSRHREQTRRGWW